MEHDLYERLNQIEVKIEMIMEKLMPELFKKEEQDGTKRN